MSPLAGVRVAVTGASGFCGAAVARLAAAAGADVVCLGRRPGPVGAHVPWDASAHPPDLTGADVVVHLAAAVGDPGRGAAAEAAFRAVNVDGTARLLDAAAGRRVVWVGSASAYRPGPYAAPVGEDHPRDAQRSAYGRTKAAGDALALAAGAVVLRPRAVYGDGDRHLLPRLRAAARGGRVLLPGPDVPMSLTAVGNLAGACLAALRWPAGAYNVADARAYRRDAVVAAATGVPVRHVPAGLARAAAAGATAWASLTGAAPALTRYAVDQLTDGMVLDTAKARATGWAPRETFEEFVSRCTGPRSGPP
ncbi:NAD-dependent epimerase/dehydratase family protein [Spirilliplanes yamanashiensis]|uniref:NAD-dependent epimerase n=1 Tax=Spirilliplanes yamanashiensis TaxID=42233 RepID=A0A8J3YAU3_9ACTN|nr:NAD(P)-dependent oxidoreductase [Spirilliplanes yamanashiensis]MDP9818802.1 nucleoside-diphosphate-sugar epimerase [Spirilliplanes yamanashiensis]GIJ05256.1 NAD-dependent epimerase [Spirilliplanes yamanashiensis]